MSEKYKEEWGSADLMAVAAFRYCLEKQKYMTVECVLWLTKYWDTFRKSTKVLIHQNIRGAIEQNFIRDKLDLEGWNSILKLDTEFNYKDPFKEKDEETFYKRGVVVLEKESDVVKEFIPYYRS